MTDLEGARQAAANSPSAFPRTGEGLGNPKYDCPGMSLRDYFAGQALAGMDQKLTDDFDYWWREPGAIAKRSYAIADAMLAARAGGDDA